MTIKIKSEARTIFQERHKIKTSNLVNLQFVDVIYLTFYNL